MPQLCADQGCPFGWDKPGAILFVLVAFPPKNGPGMRAGQHSGVVPWPVLMVGLTVFGSSPIACDMHSQDPSSEERFHVELHFSPGVKGCEEDRNIPTGFGFRPASAEVSGHLGRSCQPQGTLGHCPGPSGPAAETCLLAVPRGSWQVMSMSHLGSSGWLLGLGVPPELGRARDPSLELACSSMGKGHVPVDMSRVFPYGRTRTRRQTKAA